MSANTACVNVPDMERRSRCVRGFAVIAAAVVLTLLAHQGAPAAPATSIHDDPNAIAASFLERSYAPGTLAVLKVTTPVVGLTEQVFRAGPPAARSSSDEAMSGVAVGPAQRARVRSSRIEIGNWESGLYFVRLRAPGGKLGFAPFIVRPARLGEHRVAVVLPTNTWQAYNFRDVDGNGVGDTWYADSRIKSVDLTRPYLHHGVPPHFRGYDQGFLWWLGLHHKAVDVLADDDLARFRDAAAFLHRYDLIVFSGHEEYVTSHAYSVIQGYRDHGGNLLFLSANNFYYRVERSGSRLFKIGHWSDAGRDGTQLTGEVYVGWSKGRYPNQPYLVTGAAVAPWFFAGTGLRDGDRFGTYGIEINQRGAESPRSIVVLARIGNVFGPGRSAEMTYYATSRGAKVFSAGVMNFGGSALWPVVSRMLENLWLRTARP